MTQGVRAVRIGKNMRMFRDQANMTQEALATGVNLAGGAQIAQYEAGTKLPSLEKAMDIATQLGVSLSQLVGELPPVLSGSPITNNVVNGEHHTVYQHVEGPLLMSDAFEARLRKVVEEVVDARCEKLLEEMRRIVQDVVREQGQGAHGHRQEDP
jgi:transcriptional regulator with XRE-family HTH domain